MNVQRELLAKCVKLPYTKNNNIQDDVYDATMTELRDMWRQYGYANVFGALSMLWSYVDAVSFFARVGNSFSRGRKIQTIATSYHRACNGGVERVNAQLMNIWVHMGLKVVLFTEEQESSMDFEYPKSVKRIIISKSDMNARLNALQQHCLEEHVDLFIYHDWTNQNIIWECMLMKMLHIQFAVYCHGHFAWSFGKGKSALYQPECFKLCDMVLAISETNALFYQMCGCETYLVQNPVPNDLLIVEAIKNNNSKRILLVGRLSQEKYPKEALEIFRIVHEAVPEAVLDVVGDGILRGEMEQYVSDNRLEESVIFHGTKASNELDSYYRNAACVLFTSKMEGYPMVVLETKAYGLPLVMYEMPYLSLVRDGKGIMSAPAGDCKTMADSLIKVLTDISIRGELGQKARESFETFKEHNHISDWNNIFDILYGNVPKSSQSILLADNLHILEKNIMPEFLKKLKNGYDYEVENSINYRLGKVILRYPIKLWHYIKRVKGSIL